MIILGSNNRHNEQIMQQWMDSMNIENAKVFAVVARNPEKTKCKVLSLGNMTKYVLSKSLENIVLSIKGMMKVNGKSNDDQIHNPTNWNPSMVIVGFNQAHNELTMGEWLEKVNIAGYELFSIIGISDEGIYKFSAINGASFGEIINYLSEIIKGLENWRFSQNKQEFKSGANYNGGQNIMDIPIVISPNGYIPSQSSPERIEETIRKTKEKMRGR